MSIYIEDGSISSIYNSIYKFNKFFILVLRLLMKLIYKILISFYLYIKVIPNKVLYCHLNHYICLIVRSPFYFVTIFSNIIVVQDLLKQNL